MKRFVAVTLLALVAISGIGCALNPLNNWEELQIQEIRELGLPEKPEVSVGLARALSVVPGGGRVYLAIAGECYQAIPAVPELWLTAGTVNWMAHEHTAAPAMLLIPLWIIDFIGVGLDAEAMNNRATIKYYLNGPGREEYERRKEENARRRWRR